MSPIQGISFILLVVAVSVGADEHSSDNPCYPSAFSGDAYYHNSKIYTFKIDYGRQKILENWGGKLRTDYILYDLTQNKRYRRDQKGNCRVHTLTNLGLYARCVPKNAQLERGKIEQEYHDSAAYKYMVDGVSIIRVINRDSHLPEAIIKTKAGREVKKEFRNVVSSIEDPSVFDKDLSDCSE